MGGWKETFPSHCFIDRYIHSLYDCMCSFYIVAISRRENDSKMFYINLNCLNMLIYELSKSDFKNLCQLRNFLTILSLSRIQFDGMKHMR